MRLCCLCDNTQIVHINFWQLLTHNPWCWLENHHLLFQVFWKVWLPSKPERRVLSTVSLELVLHIVPLSIIMLIVPTLSPASIYSTKKISNAKIFEALQYYTRGELDIRHSNGYNFSICSIKDFTFPSSQQSAHLDLHPDCDLLILPYYKH